jgi:hypothetical protein
MEAQRIDTNQPEHIDAQKKGRAHPWPIEEQYPKIGFPACLRSHCHWNGVEPILIHDGDPSVTEANASRNKITLNDEGGMRMY